ncbi:MAG TPA: hypothetical protein VNB29_03320, partial [Chthoniobacterales bacterium]|nr:hypothetical protein [Chthoniobacterales bacterium]
MQLTLGIVVKHVMHDLLRRCGLLFALFLGLFIGVAIYWPEPERSLATHGAGSRKAVEDRVPAGRALSSS